MSCPTVSSVRRSALVAALFLGQLAGCGVDRSYNGPDVQGKPDMAGQGGCKCPMNQTCCGNKCVDFKVDAANCGGCNKVCVAGEMCKGGNCSCAGGAHCPADQTCCPSTGCKSLMGTDSNNCGMCGASCDGAHMGETCFGGKCGCGKADTHCTDPQVCCSDTCIDVTTDVANCGACTNTCAMGQTCSGGTCMGGMMMGGKCMVNTDCPMGQQCLGGMCLGGMGGGCMPACMAPTMCLPGFGCFGCKMDADCPQGQKCQFGILCK